MKKSKLGPESLKFERRSKYFLNPKITSTSFLSKFLHELKYEAEYSKMDQVKVVENSL